MLVNVPAPARGWSSRYERGKGALTKAYPALAARAGFAENLAPTPTPTPS